MPRRTYAEWVDPYCKDAPIITVPQAKIVKIKEFVIKLAQAKASEEHHKSDPKATGKRNITGHLAEAAVEELLHAEFMDFTIGDSKRYAVSDLKKLGLDCGVKCVTRETVGGVDSFPVISRHQRKSEIITLKLSDETIMICGVASPETLKKYQDDDLVRNKDMSIRKTGFYGFHELKSFNNLDELKSILKG